MERQQAEEQTKALELRIAAEATYAAQVVTNGYESVEAARTTRELTRKRLDAGMTKFTTGTSTDYQVVQAQRDLADAENAELRAILDYGKALVDFERVQETSRSMSPAAAAGE